jgi:hypothetical protein
MKNKNELKKYQDSLMDSAKGTIGLGILTGAGTYGFSMLGSNHPAVAPTSSAVVSGLQLLNIGNLAGVGLSIAKLPSSNNNKKSITDERLRKMLGE